MKIMDVFFFFEMPNIQIFLNVCNLEESVWCVTEKQVDILSEFSFETGLVNKRNAPGVRNTWCPQSICHFLR